MISLFVAIASSVAAPATPPQGISLDGPWRLAQAGRHISIPAVVPGVVQTDLMRAGMSLDPYFGNNGKSVQWESDLPWSYSRRFTLTPAFLKNRRIVLRCDGLDTFATLRLNGKELAKTDDMYRTWEFDAKPFLQAGINTIQVDFEPLSSFINRNEHRPEQFHRPVQEGGKVYIRKAAFQGGWDFAPQLLTMGIWRGINLLGWNAGRITSVRIRQDHSKKEGVGLAVRLDADSRGAVSARTTVTFKGRTVAESDTPLGHGTGETRLFITEPQLWWPNGLGKPNLYDLRIDLHDARGRVVDRATRRIGLRTVTWIPKTKQTPLTLALNGRRFFAKGSNWVPTDSLLRDDPARMSKLVQHAVDANMNLMRLWGGGYYETNTFFDTCDEKGLLVWLEFGYADSPYPSFDPQWLAGARAEAKDVVLRTQSHPCIGVYSGNNEVTDRIGEKTTSWQMSREEYDLLFHKTLRDVVHEFAPDTAYTPGSPEVGDTHYWSVWHGSEGFDAYTRLHGFISEYGYQAIPVPKTVAAFTTPQERSSFSTPAMLNHQKNWRDAYSLIAGAIRRTYRKPKDMDSMIWLSQIQQADGILTGVEHWRRDWPNSTASLVWQYNDPWPGTSWSMIDYYNRPKALLYRLKHAYAPVALSGVTDTKTGTAELWAASDRAEARRGRIDWTLMTLDGLRLDKGEQSVVIPAGTCSTRAASLNLSSALAGHGSTNILLFATLHTAGEPDSKALVMFAKPKELDLRPPDIISVVVPTPGGYRLTLKSVRPAISAWIDLSGIDAEFSDNFIHLQPGVPATIDIKLAKACSLSQLRRALVVRSLYDTYLPGTEATPTVDAGPDGSIVATADDADIQGNGPTLEMGTPDNLGVWRSTDNAIVWKVRGAKPGTYKVSALIAAPQNDAGGTFEIEVDGHRIPCTIPVTKSWTDYISVDLGTVVISKTGRTKITLRPLTKPRANLMNLRSLTLSVHSEHSAPASESDDSHHREPKCN